MARMSALVGLVGLTCRLHLCWSRIDAKSRKESAVQVQPERLISVVSEAEVPRRDVVSSASWSPNRLGFLVGHPDP